METQMDTRDYSNTEASPARIMDVDIHRSGVVFPKDDVVHTNVSFEFNDSISTMHAWQIAVNDDEKSAVFREILFDSVSTSVLRRNRKLFEELAKY